MSIHSPLWLLALLALPPMVFLTLRALRRQAERLTARRAAVFLLLRTAALLLLVLGLAGFGIARLSDRLSIVFLLDQSRSVSADERERALRVVETVRGRLGRGDSAVLVRFGAAAETETLEPGVPVSEEAGDVDPGATNIGAALQDGLAQAGAPSGAGGALRILLLTDGNENRGSADDAAGVAKSMGARIFPLPLGAPVRGPEVSVEEVRAPERVREAEAHEVTVMVRSRTAVSARVTLLRDAAPVATRIEQLSPGENAVQFTGSFPERGLHAWDALVEAPGDGVPQNNHNRRFVEVSGAPRILYVSKPGKGSPSLLSALSAQDISVVSRPATALPGTLAGYLPFDALILDNVPGYGISTEKMETIARYVRDAGGGLLMAGGDTSFGAGGYYKTPIERILPVDMDAKSQLDVPGLSLVLVVDKSGSMGAEVPSGGTKLDVVKAAALAAIESLNPFDKAGVIAFDADWQWAVPLTRAGDTAKIAADLATLTPGGGTIIFPALEEADRVLSASSSPLRHVILLTDGLTDAADFKTLLERMARHHITVSTVAVGDDADTELLADMARWGRGRTYATSDPRDVPRIFLTDTTLASRGLLVEKSFLPRELSAAEMVRGLSLGDLPGLRGFVLTYMKSGAEQVLSALYDAPLLAAWRCGLGRTAAFTSDLSGRWSAAFLAWDQFPRFAAQLVRWIERPADTNVLHPRIDTDGGSATVTVDAYDSLGAFVNGLDISGILLRPGGARVELRVPQTSPGLYQAVFPADEVGDYILTLSAASAEATLPPLTIGTSIAYSEEYRMLGVNSTLLERLAVETGGKVISSGDDEAGLAALLRREPGSAGAGNDAWKYFLLASLLLFLLDIAARRLAAPRELLGRLAARLRALRAKPGLSTEALAGIVARAREEERARMKRRVTGMAREGNLDPDLAAYLYIARLRSSRAAKEETKK
ncbi:MAG: VWA domain-containing protein [Spirochaetia bacterium]